MATAFPHPADEPDEPRPVPERKPVVLNGQFFADAGPDADAEAVVVVPVPRQAEEKPKASPSLLRKITTPWAIVSGAAVLSFSALGSVWLAGLSAVALVGAKATDQWSHGRRSKR